MNSGEHFVLHLLNMVPEIREIYDAHVEDNRELLPHVFMGDITRFTLQLSSSEADLNVLERVLAAVEEGLNSDTTDVSNLVAVSFIENLCGENDAIGRILPLAGDFTKKEIECICGR